MSGSRVFGAFQRFTGRLRFPQLFFLTSILFVGDLLVPDLIPLVDELLLGLITLMLGMWRHKKSGGDRVAGGGSVDVVEVGARVVSPPESDESGD